MMHFDDAMAAKLWKIIDGDNLSKQLDAALSAVMDNTVPKNPSDKIEALDVSLHFTVTRDSADQKPEFIVRVLPTTKAQDAPQDNKFEDAPQDNRLEDEWQAVRSRGQKLAEREKYIDDCVRLTAQDLLGYTTRLHKQISDLVGLAFLGSGNSRKAIVQNKEQAFATVAAINKLTGNLVGSLSAFTALAQYGSPRVAFARDLCQRLQSLKKHAQLLLTAPAESAYLQQYHPNASREEGRRQEITETLLKEIQALEQESQMVTVKDKGASKDCVADTAFIKSSLMMTAHLTLESIANMIQAAENTATFKDATEKCLWALRLCRRNLEAMTMSLEQL